MDPWGMCVSSENFSDQLQVLKRVANPISLTDYVRALAADDLPERCVVVTFDDGYVDNHDQALPLLRQHQVPATLFVTTCNIDSDREFWWDRLETLLLEPEQLPRRLALVLPQGRVEWDLDAAASYNLAQRYADCDTPAWRAMSGTRLAFYYNIWKTLWPLPSQTRDSAIDLVAEWAGHANDQPSSRRTMTSDELCNVARSVWLNIGAHTVDHPPLPAHSESEQAKQIRQSKARLEDIIGTEVTAFAYPHGEYSQETIRLLRESGFECAVTVEQRIAHRHTDPMRLPRFGIGNIDARLFEERLNTWFELPPVAGEH
jgi:peptidoglycan/xylan/chitin deacetylase (PgdA/CDA1 family)